MKIHNIHQRSPEWFKLRCGIPTASEFDRIILPSGKRSGQARRYMHQLAYERVMGKRWERGVENIAHAQYGIVNEDRAAMAFEAHTGFKTATIGFITDDAETIGCSPDRILLDNQALEIKCPTGPTQCGYLIDGIEDAYRAQIQGQILIGGFDVVHFFAWHEELPAYYVKVEPDDTFLRTLAQYLRDFNNELMRGVIAIRQYGHWPKNTPSVFPDEPDDAA